MKKVRAKIFTTNDYVEVSEDFMMVTKNATFVCAKLLSDHLAKSDMCLAHLFRNFGIFKQACSGYVHHKEVIENINHPIFKRVPASALVLLTFISERVSPMFCYGFLSCRSCSDSGEVLINISTSMKVMRDYEFSESHGLDLLLESILDQIPEMSNDAVLPMKDIKLEVKIEGSEGSAIEKEKLQQWSCSIAKIEGRRVPVLHPTQESIQQCYGTLPFFKMMFADEESRISFGVGLRRGDLVGDNDTGFHYKHQKNDSTGDRLIASVVKVDYNSPSLVNMGVNSKGMGVSVVKTGDGPVNIEASLLMGFIVISGEPEKVATGTIEEMLELLSEKLSDG